MEKFIIRGFLALLLVFGVFLTNFAAYIGSKHIYESNSAMYQAQEDLTVDESKAQGVTQDAEKRYFMEYDIKRTIEYSPFSLPKITRDTVIRKSMWSKKHGY